MRVGASATAEGRSRRAVPTREREQKATRARTSLVLVPVLVPGPVVPHRDQHAVQRVRRNKRYTRFAWFFGTVMASASRVARLAGGGVVYVGGVLVAYEYFRPKPPLPSACQRCCTFEKIAPKCALKQQ